MDYSGTLLLGRYRILQFLGEGGMSRVYKAQDITSDALVTVKFLKQDITSSYIEDFIRFRKELEIVSRLAHPGIANVFASGEYEGVFFYVMELLDGESFD